MSTMLEQAIIDAAALRETAIKSAENALIEKYNKEFKDTVNKLLEQEETADNAPETQEMSPETASANTEDPAAPTLTDAPAAPDANLASPTQTQTKAFEKVKSAFFDLEGDDDELVTITFDGLKANPVTNIAGGLPDMGAELAAPAQQPEMPMMESLDEEVEIELESYDRNIEDNRYYESIELDEEEDLNDDSSNDKETSSDSIEEEITLSEEELKELEEHMKVDMSNEYEGYVGTTKKKKREFEAVAYAAARDNDMQEEMEEKKKYISDLEESINKLSSKYDKQKSAYQKLLKENEKLVEFAHGMKEQIEQINLSNAKLLYTNKALSNSSFNERQKNNIVENIAKASNVAEAKTIYETLQSTVQSVREEVAPKSLSEALNRNNSPFLVRKQPASHNEVFAERMKALAGIKRLE